MNVVKIIIIIALSLGLLNKSFAADFAPPTQAAQAVPPVPDPLFRPCTPPSQSPRERSPASTTMSEAVARHAEIMPAASSSDPIAITRGEWEDLMTRLSAIEEWLRVAPRVRRF